jgi:hypothetical protein
VHQLWSGQQFDITSAGHEMVVAVAVRCRWFLSQTCGIQAYASTNRMPFDSNLLSILKTQTAETHNGGHDYRGNGMA